MGSRPARLLTPPATAYATVPFLASRALEAVAALDRGDVAALESALTDLRLGSGRVLETMRARVAVPRVQPALHLMRAMGATGDALTAHQDLHDRALTHDRIDAAMSELAAAAEALTADALTLEVRRG